MYQRTGLRIDAQGVLPNSENLNATQNIQLAADQLWQAARERKECSPIRELIGADNISAAYQVQLINHHRYLEQGKRVVGRKIGLTSLAVQQQLGVDQPDFGFLYDHMHITNTKSISWEELMQPKIEAEIALIMARDLPTCSHEEQLAEAVEYAMASIEIVGSRIQNWDIKIADTIADNASASHFVLGDKQVALGDADLINCEMQLTKNGEVVSNGVGQNCLGSPIKAAYWLAQIMIEYGQPLMQGDIILSGALGPMVAIAPGDQISAAISGLGTVSVGFND